VIGEIFVPQAARLRKYIFDAGPAMAEIAVWGLTLLILWGAR
jgi:hypothetical protein